MNVRGYDDRNTMITVQNLALSLGCLAEKRFGQLRTGNGDDAVLREQIMEGLDEAIELFRTVNDYSYRYHFLTYSLFCLITYLPAHSIAQL